MPRTVSPRTAYVLTKVAVFAVAALLTWPLSRLIGLRAWWGLAAFGVILVALTFVVFFAVGRRETVPDGTGVDVESGRAARDARFVGRVYRDRLPGPDVHRRVAQQVVDVPVVLLADRAGLGHGQVAAVVEAGVADGVAAAVDPEHHRQARVAG